MPNRILQERICTSETIAQLTSDEERFFYRLLVQCDDYGRFDGRPAVIRARCFALQVDVVSDEDVARWLAVLERVGLVATYTVGGRAFLQVVTWTRYQQTRAMKSKFPAPDDASPASDSNCNQTPADVPDIRESFSENREAKSGERESLRDSTPLPPPQAEGENPPTPRKRGARQGRERRREPAQLGPLAALTPRDMQTWNAARDRLQADMLTANWQKLVAPLTPIGRAPDGGLQLRAPPGHVADVARLTHYIARALRDVGDPQATHVAIVE